MQAMTGKVAVVTGAASGIGRAMAERFVAEGMCVVLADVEEGPLRAVEHLLREGGAQVKAVLTDVSDGESVENLAQATLRQFGTAHLVCNNAGVGGFGGFSWQLPTSAWEWTLGVNLWGVIHGIRSFVPILVEQGEGHIVNTASISGFAGGMGSSPYTASKHAVIGLSDSLRVELAMIKSPVNVSVLCPGRIDTAIGDADRNWPERLGSLPERRQADQLGPFPIPEVLQGMFAAPMATSVVADLVLDAVRSERFWILSHPAAVQTLMESRTANLESG
jgi:NAD(P)-dependent dehydrogenase (short-subunit alcohol dehydrogenase family)